MATRTKSTPKSDHLELVDISKAKLMKNNPRKSHKIAALARSLRQYGFGQALTLNRTTGQVIAGNGRIRVLRKMKRDGEPAPAGVTVDGKRWLVPAMFGDWTEEEQGHVGTALNGGVNGSLEGDLDAEILALQLEQADDATREATGLSDEQVAQYLADFAAPYIEPQVSLEAIERTTAAAAAATERAVKLLVPEPLAKRARKIITKGTPAAELLLRGVENAEKAISKRSTTAAS